MDKILTIVLVLVFALRLDAQNLAESSLSFPDFLNGLAAAEETINDLWARYEVKLLNAKDNLRYEYEWGYRDGMEFMRGLERTCSHKDGTLHTENLLLAFNGKYLRTLSFDVNGGTVRYLDWSMATRLTPITFTYRSPFKRLSEVLREGKISKFHTGFSELTGTYVAEIEASLKKFDLRVIIDLERGFRPVLWEFYKPGRDILTGRTEVQLVEATRGLWLPKMGRQTGYFVLHYEDPEPGEIICLQGFALKQTRLTWQLEVLEWRTGVHLPKQVFQPKFPLGCKVWDDIIGIGYVVGEGFDVPPKLDLRPEIFSPKRKIQVSPVAMRSEIGQHQKRGIGSPLTLGERKAEKVTPGSRGDFSDKPSVPNWMAVSLKIGIAALFALFAALLTLLVIRAFQKNGKHLSSR